MSVVLLDTSVASLLHPEKKGDAVRNKYEPHMHGQRLAVSFQRIAESWQWAEVKKWGDKKCADLDAFVRRFLVIPYDYQLARVWARCMSAARSSGRRLEAGDCWIIATAVHRGIPLLTHDRDMVGLHISGLSVVSYVEERDVEERDAPP